jgi:hypothetical protein
VESASLAALKAQRRHGLDYRIPHQGLPEQRACPVLAITPRSLQSWRLPAMLATLRVPRPRPVTALAPAEAAAVVSIIRWPRQLRDGDVTWLTAALLALIYPGVAAAPPGHRTDRV